MIDKSQSPDYKGDSSQAIGDTHIGDDLLAVDIIEDMIEQLEAQLDEVKGLYRSGEVGYKQYDFQCDSIGHQLQAWRRLHEKRTQSINIDTGEISAVKISRLARFVRRVTGL